ncbi:response regulator [Chromobacterium piscinae]|uniref:response regulator n=1 Tax=Chromobacterium piscinae TaxID=686831 RepID=UPI001E5A358B|nr:helix-turn-helix domain-containing protein [Chromobacterium piscinae]MCD5327945.1 response regulator [Chromobacterium piscinae]
MIDDFKTQFLSRLTQMMDLRGVTERERSGWLRDLLGIDTSSAGRKMKGFIAFNLEEVSKVAKALNCTSDYLLALSEESISGEQHLPGIAFQGLGLQTTLVCDRLPDNEVTVMPARMVGAPENSEYIAWISREPNWQPTLIAAWQDPAQFVWWIGPVQDIPADTPRHCVYAYLALGPGIGPYRIAVLDDRAETAELMQSYLEQAGYIADTFTRTEALRNVLVQRRYDAFVLDWSMGRGETTEALMQEIRRRNGSAIPIILMTGEASEADTERAIELLGVRYFQKTVRTPPFRLVVAQLKKDLRELS